MKEFLRRISPRAAFSDFLHEWQAPTPHRWQVLGVSVAATFALMVMFLPESQRADPRPPTVTWITTFAPDRTQAEIVASNLANQKRHDALRAEAAAREERRKELYRTLGRMTGVDVDEMEAEIDREKAAEEAAAQQPAQPQQQPQAQATSAR
jgi:hypothetical protein